MRYNKRVDNIISNGKVFTKDKIKLYYLPVENAKSEIFFSLSKKIFNAVERNYIKRVIKEIIKREKFPFNFFIKVTDKKVSYYDLLGFFASFKEHIINEKVIDNIDKNL